MAEATGWIPTTPETSKEDWGSPNEAPWLPQHEEGAPRWLPPTLFRSPRVYDSKQLGI